MDSTNANELIQCVSCGALYEREDMMTGVYDDGPAYCKDCSVQCHHCGEHVCIDDAAEYDGEWYCPDCMGACDYCGEPVPDYFLDDIGGPHRYYWVCPECIHDVLRCCDCGRYVPEGEVRYAYDDVYCADCVPVEPIHVYTYTPEQLIFRAVDGEPPTDAYYGVELEAEGDDNDAAAAEVAGDESFLYCKYDGSVEGFETVSHPMTLRFHTETQLWDDVCRTLKNHGYRSHDAEGSCGLHVHISRKAFNADNAAVENMVLFCERHFREVLKFSRRTRDHLAQWAARYFTDYEMDDLTASNALDKVGYKLDCANRYRMVNVQNCATVELRMFRGTLNPSTIKASIQFCAALLDISNTRSTAEILELSFQTLMAPYAERYSELKEYMVARGIYADVRAAM